jgi:hypothetical protein
VTLSVNGCDWVIRFLFSALSSAHSRVMKYLVVLNDRAEDLV